MFAGVIFAAGAEGLEVGDVTVGGNYLGIAGWMRQDNRGATDAKRRGLDAAFSRATSERATRSVSWSPVGPFDVAFAVTNGTDESATNPDGKFEVSGRLGVDIVPDRVRIAVPGTVSDDTGPTGGSGVEVVTDQKVRRYQVGLAYRFGEDWMAKVEYFPDDYERTSSGRVDGVVGALAGRF